MRKVSYLFIGVIFLVGIAGFNLDAQTGPSLDFVGKDAPVAKPGSKVNKYRDLELTIKIRRLLSEDPDLGQLNIGVSVRDGVLRLWGPVPSVEKTQKALAKVGTVKLLFDVKSDLYLGVIEDIPPPIFIKD
ncbi:MAG: BON domain-containing protein [Planctomycetota bacterium]|nr:BON domain-containing protein [Gemmataceae bacterium]NBS88963.1 BON domain-containing protein [bacterium]NBT60837.1 BON domain-containing protein [Planctomycetia bacterium]RLS60419.1 MAG: BON domain-containing protein [Planctomycetota bacterium]RLS90362.1 MAG: BON domain-containing protein [Planctomycetota bacterium]